MNYGLHSKQTDLALREQISAPDAAGNSQISQE